jgi:ABC-type uncharacterized transport system permease subunit
VLGLGMTITVAPLTTTVMAAVSGARAGVASGINNAVARVASLLAIAVLGIVFVWSHNVALATQLDRLNVPQQSRQSIQLLEPGTAAQPAAGEPQVAHSGAIDAAQSDAISAALRAVALVCAACALAGAAGALVTVRSTGE